MSLQMQDTSLFERKLRPIYDSLEVGNNRKALQETEKVLKKHPNLLCARALKGLALMRLGRYEESQSVLKIVACEKPVDDSTLQVLSFCYKELEQLDKIVDLYNHAVKQTPGNEELLAHLFISHVRLEDFKSQHAVALQLYKTQTKNAYYFWAVMSLVLQATRGPESRQLDKRQLYLALSQRMVDKLLKENKLEAAQEAELYLRILVLQDKHQEALNFLNDERCEKLYPAAPIYTKIDLLKKLEKWQEINTLLKKLLADERDRWDFYQDYLSSCFKLLELQDKTQQSHENCADEIAADNGKVFILDECHDFICQIIESGNKKYRGPYLARLELHKRMREQALNAQELLGDFNDLILEYFRLFGQKLCCTQDIALFLPSISLEQRHALANKLLQESGISSKTLPQNKDQMQKHICALQISRICGTHIELNEEHLLAFYATLKLHYEHGLSNFGKNLLQTDIGPSDNYALLAANVMYDLSRQQQKSDRIFEGLCLLQYVLRNSTSNYYVKLFSLKIYHMFGCLLGAQEMYDYLDIKHIQLDSMGYVHCNALPLCGRFSMARTAFDNTLKFFTNSYKERLEYIALAYRFCTFNKLEEFMNFKERLSNSMHYVAISVEAQLCDLVTLYGNVQQNLSAYSAMSIEPQDDRIAWNDLSDNRDLKAIIPWDPVHLLNTEEERKESYAQEMEVLQIRSLMLRLLSACVDLFHAPGVAASAVKKMQISSSAAAKLANTQNCNENHSSSAKDTDTLELLRESWTGLFQRVRLMNYQPLPNAFLNSLLPTRLHLLLDMPYEKFFADLSQLVLDFYYGSSKLAMQCKTVCDNVSGLLEQCAIVVRESDTAEDGLWRRREWQNRIAACLELMSLYAFILSVLHEKLQERMNKSKTKKKSAENSNAEQTISGKERAQMLSELLRQLKTKLQNTELLIQNWKAPALPRDLNSFMADMSLKPEVEATLIGDVASVFKESHELMISELRNLLKDKMRMVSK